MQNKPKRAARKAKKAENRATKNRESFDAHVKTRRADRVKKGKRKADEARKDAVASNKRAAEKKKGKDTAVGYAQQEINRRAASRASARNRRR